MWACCGGASDKPASDRYRGKYPWEAVETALLRDFILDRRVDGRQQLKAIFNWHSYGEFVMWPYGYTKEDVPPTMTLDDHNAMVALGRQIATLNGYRAKQGSDSYIYDGDLMAWAYGDQRIMGFAFAMYPGWGDNAGGFKPDDEVLERETTRNTDAALYFIEEADCTYRSIGLARTHCGPLHDDFETDRGWTVASNAPTGGWERGLPEVSRTAAASSQRADVPSGRADLVTGASHAGNPNANDVDGRTTALSPELKLGSGAWWVRFRFTFAHDAAASAADYLRLSVVDGAVTTPLWTASGKASERNARWRTKRFSLNAWAGKTVRLLVEANDGATDNLVEAAVDDTRVFRPR